MISYQYDTDRQILDVLFSGMIAPIEILHFMQDINRNHDLPRILDVIIDVRTADFEFEPIAIQNIAKANFRMNKSFKKINNAILANNPEDTTLTLFHQFTTGSANYHVKIFKSKEKAETWLKR